MPDDYHPYLSALADIEYAEETHATRLAIRGENLESLPSAIANLAWLQHLDLSGNALTTLPPEIGELTKLETLTLSNNQISTLPAQFSNLTELRELDLTNNQISEFPYTVLGLPKLMILRLGGNNLSALPHDLDKLKRLQILDVSSNKLSALPEATLRLHELERAADLGPSFGIHLQDNPLNLPFGRCIVPGNPRATKNLFQLLRDMYEPRAGTIASTASSSLPPDIPAQGIGVHFEMRDDGVVDFAPPEALDRAGNHVRRLRLLQPEICRLVSELIGSLSGGNAAHCDVAARLADYRQLIALPLGEIEFAVLALHGLRLENAVTAAADQIAAKELPPFSTSEQERLRSLLQAHAVFISATAEGSAILEAEQRYQRRPEEERKFRATMLEISRELKNRPDVIAPDSAMFLAQAAEEIGQGAKPERASVAGAGPVRNALIVVTSGAVIASLPVSTEAIIGSHGVLGAWIASLIATEGLKKAKAFQAVAGAATRGLDWLHDTNFRELCNRLRPHRELVLGLEEPLSAIAGLDQGFSWLKGALYWLKSDMSIKARLPCYVMYRDQVTRNIQKIGFGSIEQAIDYYARHADGAMIDPILVYSDEQNDDVVFNSDKLQQICNALRTQEALAHSGNRFKGPANFKSSPLRSKLLNLYSPGKSATEWIQEIRAAEPSLKVSCFDDSNGIYIINIESGSDGNITFIYPPPSRNSDT